MQRACAQFFVPRGLRWRRGKEGPQPQHALHSLPRNASVGLRGRPTTALRQMRLVIVVKILISGFLFCWVSSLACSSRRFYHARMSTEGDDAQRRGTKRERELSLTLGAIVEHMTWVGSGAPFDTLDVSRHVKLVTTDEHWTAQARAGARTAVIMVGRSDVTQIRPYREST